MEKYGFVYLWRDKKHKRYYIGSHWGNEDDGYICSSTWMRQAYTHRPQDFKRRILAKIKTSRADLLSEETRWLSMIRDDEIKVRYYNLNIKGAAHWTADEQKAREIRQKISDTHWSKNPEAAKLTKQKISEAGKGREPPNKGVPMSDEQKQKLSESLSGRSSYDRTEDQRAQISTRVKEEWASGARDHLKGPQNLSEETRRLKRENNAMKNPIHRAKVAAAKKGIKYLNKGGKNKMAVPGTAKWNDLICSGWIIGRA